LAVRNRSSKSGTNCTTVKLSPIVDALHGAVARVEIEVRKPFEEDHPLRLPTNTLPCDLLHRLVDELAGAGTSRNLTPRYCLSTVRRNFAVRAAGTPEARICTISVDRVR